MNFWTIQDNAGRAHFNGGATNHTNYNLDGFNISDPVTGNLETGVNPLNSRNYSWT